MNRGGIRLKIAIAFPKIDLVAYCSALALAGSVAGDVPPLKPRAGTSSAFFVSGDSREHSNRNATRNHGELDGPGRGPISTLLRTNRPQLRQDWQDPQAAPPRREMVVRCRQGQGLPGRATRRRLTTPCVNQASLPL